MDAHGGKGSCMGPRNYLGTGYASVPIMITVEGANILTRSLIILAEPRRNPCHPYVLRELQGADADLSADWEEFDQALSVTLATR